MKLNTRNIGMTFIYVASALLSLASLYFLLGN